MTRRIYATAWRTACPGGSGAMRWWPCAPAARKCWTRWRAPGRTWCFPIYGCRGWMGVELMQRLSRDYPQVKIVILSGYSDFKYLNMSIRNHVAEYLLKPTDVDDFEETFRRLKASMDHERLRRAQITESVLRHFHAWLSALLGGVATPRGHRPLSAHADRGGHRPGQPADRGVRPGRPRRGRALRPGGPLAQGVGNRGRPAAGPVPPRAWP